MSVLSECGLRTCGVVVLPCHEQSSRLLAKEKSDSGTKTVGEVVTKKAKKVRQLTAALAMAAGERTDQVQCYDVVQR